MRNWRAVRTIVAFELRREWIGILATLLFATYFSLVFPLGVLDPAKDAEVYRFMGGMRDWVYLFGFPLFGCKMHRTVFAYWREDPFTRRIAHWRTMPIPLPAIVGARYVQAALFLAIAGTFFIGVQYAVFADLRERIALSDWIAAGIVWMSYGFAVQAAYIRLELGSPGKTFVKGYLGYTLALGVICSLAAWQNVQIIDRVQTAVSRHPALLPLVAVAVALLALALGRRLTLKRMANRQYTF